MIVLRQLKGLGVPSFQDVEEDTWGMKNTDKETTWWNQGVLKMSYQENAI